ncbi:hypothetical protein ISCGN_018313 [Ixodes scapularis]
MKPERRKGWTLMQAAPPGVPLRANKNAAGFDGAGPTKMPSTLARCVWDFRVSPVARCNSPPLVFLLFIDGNPPRPLSASRPPPPCLSGARKARDCARLCAEHNPVPGRSCY